MTSCCVRRCLLSYKSSLFNYRNTRPLLVKRAFADYYPLPQHQPPPPDSQLPSVELVQNVDWGYVERLLPQTQVPTPRAKPEYPSGWTPQTFSDGQKYWVSRTVNHMLPVHLRILTDGLKRFTSVKHVHGDIFLMHNDLKRHLEEINGKYLRSQVNEARMVFQFNGDHVDQIKAWMRSKGF